MIPLRSGTGTDVQNTRIDVELVKLPVRLVGGAEGAEKESINVKENQRR